MNPTRSRIAKLALVLLAASSFFVTGIESAPAAAPSWSTIPSPNVAGMPFNGLTGMACASASNCFAVGGGNNYQHGKILIARWNGDKWSAVASAGAGSNAGLEAVSCPNPTNCVAVGTRGTSTVQTTLIEHWNGSKWTIVPSPTPGPPGIIDVRGVSCAGASSCMAVGYTYANDTGAFRPLVEWWNGTKWSVVPSPNPHGSGSLHGVSCTGAKNCFAVGNFDKGNGGGPLIERWNGTALSVAQRPFPPGATTSELAAVSCTNAKSCMAVGWRRPGYGYGGLTERWNGKKWTIVSPPRLAGAPGSQLFGVSCVSGTSCVAVGNYSKSGPDSGNATLTEHWNGTTWTIAASPNPTNFAGLGAVSCTSASSCLAVGSVARIGGSKTLALKYS